jgi:hypothetical protein
MPQVESVRRITLVLAAAILLAGALSCKRGPAIVSDSLPLQLSDKEFWQMITDFSESGGYFRSDNLLSNEAGYQSVIPSVKKSIPSHGVYLGVGPEQNFTYIVAFEPKMAFIVDIRRQNMLEHLLYKALMELSSDRVEFLSRLFSRPPPKSLDSDSSPETLVRAYGRARPSEDLFEANVRLVIDHLVTRKGFALSHEDEAKIRYVYQAFFDSGADLRYTFIGGYGGFLRMPSYGDLMVENDGHARNWNFLATEDQYRIIRSLQQRNLIVPLVGDFAGPKAILSVADYLKHHDAVLTVFYTSNVEQYLFQDDENWKRFYENVGRLPMNPSSVFIRYVLDSWGFNRQSRSLVSPVMDVVRGYDHGRIRSYYDVVDISR